MFIYKSQRLQKKQSKPRNLLRSTAVAAEFKCGAIIQTTVYLLQLVSKKLLTKPIKQHPSAVSEHTIRMLWQSRGYRNYQTEHSLKEQRHNSTPMAVCITTCFVCLENNSSRRGQGQVTHREVRLNIKF